MIPTPVGAEWDWASLLQDLKDEYVMHDPSHFETSTTYVLKFKIRALSANFDTRAVK